MTKDLAGGFRSFAVGLFLLVRWVGGPGVTATLRTGDEHRLGRGFLAGRAVAAALNFLVTRLIRRHFRNRRPA